MYKKRKSGRRRTYIKYEFARAKQIPDPNVRSVKVLGVYSKGFKEKDEVKNAMEGTKKEIVAHLARIPVQFNARITYSFTIEFLFCLYCRRSCIDCIIVNIFIPFIGLIVKEFNFN